MKLKCDRCGTTGYRGADRQPDKFHEGCPAKVADSKNIKGIWRVMRTDRRLFKCDQCAMIEGWDCEMSGATHVDCVARHKGEWREFKGNPSFTTA